MTKSHKTFLVISSFLACGTLTFAQDSVPSTDVTHAAATDQVAPPQKKVADTDTAAPAAPSPELVKKARIAGFKTEVSKNGTLFCREDASVGTHFTTKKCVDEGTLTAILNQRLRTRDELQKPASCAGAGCNPGN